MRRVVGAARVVPLGVGVRLGRERRGRGGGGAAGPSVGAGGATGPIASVNTSGVDLAGRAMLVTGGSSGIGRATAQALAEARRGASLVESMAPLRLDAGLRAAAGAS